VLVYDPLLPPVKQIEVTAVSELEFVPSCTFVSFVVYEFRTPKARAHSVLESKVSNQLAVCVREATLGY
jgi:hypothetical protein